MNHKFHDELAANDYCISTMPRLGLRETRPAFHADRGSSKGRPKAESHFYERDAGIRSARKRRGYPAWKGVKNPRESLKRPLLGDRDRADCQPRLHFLLFSLFPFLPISIAGMTFEEFLFPSPIVVKPRGLFTCFTPCYTYADYYFPVSNQDNQV